MTRKENLDEVRDIETDLIEIDRKCNQLLKKTNKHLTNLADLIDAPFKYDSHVFRTEHEELEDSIIDFVKSFRSNRKEMFAITEHVMDSEKLNRLLKA